MWEGTESIEIAAPPEAVWEIIADVSRHAALAGSGEVKAIRMDGPLGVGAAWEADEKIRIAGSFTARSECIALEPYREFSWRSSPPPLKKGNTDSVPDVTWTYRLAPSAKGTRLEQSFRVVEPSVGAGMLKVFYAVTRRAGTIRKGIRGTLHNVKAAAESVSPDR